jgi:hypothetical protein
VDLDQQELKEQLDLQVDLDLQELKEQLDLQERKVRLELKELDLLRFHLTHQEIS